MKSRYKLDHDLGLRYFITDTRGIGGRLRVKVEDFDVEELPLPIPAEPYGEHTHFTLEKRNWETIGAIKAIARALGVSRKRFGFAGIKDKRAVTRQRVSAWRVEPEQLAGIKVKNIKLYGFMKSNHRLSLGDSKGNSFRVTIRDVQLVATEVKEVLASASGQITGSGVPNYFGYQRFGISRPVTHLVGRELVLGNPGGAVMRYLGYPYETEDAECRMARQYIEETCDYRGALDLYPKKLGYERSMLDALAKNPRDYVGALRRLPRKLRTMLVHAYQAYLFNKILSKVIEEEIFNPEMTLPLLGYRTSLKGIPAEIAKNILEEEGIGLKNFFIRFMPEVSTPGGLRRAGMEVALHYEVANENTPLVRVSFRLPKGSYATVVLRELMKVDPHNY
jgi:tRNA pseudouridine13 synthase